VGNSAEFVGIVELNVHMAQLVIYVTAVQHLLK
jgi:hypothetical protein